MNKVLVAVPPVTHAVPFTYTNFGNDALPNLPKSLCGRLSVGMSRRICQFRQFIVVVEQLFESGTLR